MTHDLLELSGALELANGVPALHPERKGQLNRSKLKNWVEKNGGLPTYINSIATALLRENPAWSISRVIATAVNAAKKMCGSGTAFGGKAKVSKAVQTAACNAVAQWEKKKASASTVMVDDKILELTQDKLSVEYGNAVVRKKWREEGREIVDVIALSDEEMFAHVFEEEYDVVEDIFDEGGE